jgi:hypothetical protein
MHVGWQNGEKFTIGDHFCFTLNFCPDGPFFMKGVLNSIRIRVCWVAEVY